MGFKDSIEMALDEYISSQISSTIGHAVESLDLPWSGKDNSSLRSFFRSNSQNTKEAALARNDLRDKLVQIVLDSRLSKFTPSQFW